MAANIGSFATIQSAVLLYHPTYSSGLAYQSLA